MHQKNLKKILIIRFSSIGDIVLTTPVVRCLKKQVPGLELHYLTKDSFKATLANNPYIDKLWTVQDDLSDVIEMLKKEKFDFVADLHHNLRSFKVRTALGVHSAAFNKLNVQKWLLVNFKMNLLPETHIVNRYLKTVESFGVKYDGEGLDYFISPNDEVEIKNLPDPWRNGYVGMVIGAKHATKRLPTEKIIELINKMNLPVILLGGKEDFDTAELISASTGNLVFNACGKYNLSQSASLVKNANFIITHDTGLMHIAAAFRQRIISVWGNTIPEFGMSPFLPQKMGESVIMDVKGLSCRPCSKIGFEKCPKGHFKCMIDIDIESIVNQAYRWWKIA